MSEKRIRHFTFKIDIDYLIRAKYQNATATQVQALREQAFNAFCNDFAKLVESYKGAQGVLILHNKDTKHKKVKNRYILVLDEKQNKQSQMIGTYILSFGIQQQLKQSKSGAKF